MKIAKSCMSARLCSSYKIFSTDLVLKASLQKLLVNLILVRIGSQIYLFYSRDVISSVPAGIMFQRPRETKDAS